MTEIPAPEIPAIDWPRAVGFRRALFGDKLDNLRRLGAAFSDIGQFSLPPHRFVVVNSPALVGDVLVTNADSFRLAPPGGPASSGKGVTGATGDAHRRLRRIVAPALGPRKISAWAELIVDETERMADGWADGASMEIASEMTRLSLGIIGKVVCGRDLRDKSDPLGAAHAVFSDTRQARLPGAKRRRQQQQRAARAAFEKELETLIAARRTSGVDHGDFLTSLLQAKTGDGGELTDAEIRDELLIPLAGDYRTVAASLAWTLLLLAQNPEAQKKVQREADGISGRRNLTSEDVPALTETLRAYKESLRLYPPLPTLARAALKDVAVGPYCVPAGAIVQIHPFLLHRRPEIFPDPEKFEPERFRDDAEKNWPRHAYLPFGGGARRCLGDHFSLMESSLVLATLARRLTFQFALGAALRSEIHTVLHPRHGLKARVRRHSVSHVR